MNQKESGLAGRLLQTAKDLVWEDALALRKPPSKDSPSGVNDTVLALAAATATAACAAATPDIALESELMAVVMNRPTAYSAMKEAISALAEISMDEATRYRSAFAVLKKTQQRSVEQIEQAIDVHIGMLESEKARFTGQSKQAEEAEITSRTTEAAGLNAAVEDSNRHVGKLREDTEALVGKLQQDIQGKQERVALLLREAEQKKTAIMQTARKFQAASEAVQKNLSDERSRIRQYLGNASSD